MGQAAPEREPRGRLLPGPRPVPVRLRAGLPPRAAGLLPPDRPHPADPAGAPGQLVEPLPPLHRGVLPRPHGPLRGRGAALLGGRARHGLAPGGHRPGDRQRVDRIHLGPRALPRPRALPGRPALPRHAGDPQPPPRRRHPPPRVRLHPHDAPSRRGPGLGRGHRLRYRRQGLHRRLPGARPPPVGGRGRRLLVAGLAAGRRHRHPGPGPAVDAQPRPLPGLRARAHPHRAGRPGGALPPPPRHLLPLRRRLQPPHARRLLRGHHHHLGLPALPARVHRDSRQYRLLLVVQRHRRAHVRDQGRRDGGPLGPARLLLPHQPPPLDELGVQLQGAVALQPRRPRHHGGPPAAAPPPRALPVHLGAPRPHRGRRPGAPRLPRRPPGGGRLLQPRRVSLRGPARRAHGPQGRPGQRPGPGAGVAAPGHLVRPAHRAALRGGGRGRADAHRLPAPGPPAGPGPRRQHRRRRRGHRRGRRGQPPPPVGAGGAGCRRRVRAGGGRRLARPGAGRRRAHPLLAGLGRALRHGPPGDRPGGARRRRPRRARGHGASPVRGRRGAARTRERGRPGR